MFERPLHFKTTIKMTKTSTVWWNEEFVNVIHTPDAEPEIISFIHYERVMKNRYQEHSVESRIQWQMVNGVAAETQRHRKLAQSNFGQEQPQ